jgi:hypothetical protein
LDAARKSGQLSLYEVRTTVFQDLNDNIADIKLLSCIAQGCDRYVLQQGRPELCPSPAWKEKKMIDLPALKHLANAAKTTVGYVYVRSRFGLDKVE